MLLTLGFDTSKSCENTTCKGVLEPVQVRKFRCPKRGKKAKISVLSPPKPILRLYRKLFLHFPGIGPALRHPRVAFSKVVCALRRSVKSRSARRSALLATHLYISGGEMICQKPCAWKPAWFVYEVCVRWLPIFWQVASTLRRARGDRHAICRDLGERVRITKKEYDSHLIPLDHACSDRSHFFPYPRSNPVPVVPKVCSTAAKLGGMKTLFKNLLCIKRGKRTGQWLRLPRLLTWTLPQFHHDVSGTN